MANLNRVWKRWMATGCLHSTHACAEYQRNVRAFKAAFHPARHIELGDLLETTALRSGARGTKDEAEPLEPDVNKGLAWLAEMEPSDWLLGNHDDRIIQLLSHPSAIVAELARRLWSDMQAAAEKAGAKIHPYDIERGWIRVGNMYMGHGYMYNINALRDHVEMMGGNVVMAHLHVAHTFRARNHGGHWGVCVGTGGDPRTMGYARRRRQTLAWNHGIAYGEYTDNDSTMQLLQWNCAHGAKESPRWLIS
jgi:hypothetical protein